MERELQLMIDAAEAIAKTIRTEEFKSLVKAIKALEEVE